MKNAAILKPGDVVQFNPSFTGNPYFAGCLAIVSEPRSWGALVYVPLCGRTLDVVSIEQRAFYRAKFEDIEYVGTAVWTKRNSEDEPA